MAIKANPDPNSFNIHGNRKDWKQKSAPGNTRLDPGASVRQNSATVARPSPRPQTDGTLAAMDKRPRYYGEPGTER